MAAGQTGSGPGDGLLSPVSCERSEPMMTTADPRLQAPPMLPPPWLQTRQPIDEVIVTGRLTVDIAALVVSVDGGRLKLSANELRLLVVLATRLERAVLYDELVRMLWWSSYDPTDERMRAAHHHILRVTISRLRQRLGPTAAGLIVTIPSIGLRLERVPPGELPPPPPRRPTLAERGRWARSHARCVACGTTARRHWAHGLCEGCRPHDRPTRWELLRSRSPSGPPPRGVHSTPDLRSHGAPTPRHETEDRRQETER